MENEEPKKEKPERPEYHEAIAAIKEQSVAIRGIASHIEALTTQITADNKTGEDAEKKRHAENLYIERRFLRWQKANVIVSGVLTAFTLGVLALTFGMSYQANKLSAIGLAAQVAITNVQSPDKDERIVIGFTNTGHAPAQNVKVVVRNQSANNPPDTYDPFAVDAAHAQEHAEEKRVISQQIVDSYADEKWKIDALKTLKITDDQRQQYATGIHQYFERMRSNFRNAIAPHAYIIPELDENVTVTLVQQLKFLPDQTIFAYGTYSYDDGVPKSSRRQVPFCLRYTASTVDSCLKFRSIGDYLKEGDAEPDK